MQVICPHCQLNQNMRPDELLGRYYICRHCKELRRWDAPQEGEGDGWIPRSVHERGAPSATRDAAAASSEKRPPAGADPP